MEEMVRTARWYQFFLQDKDFRFILATDIDDTLVNHNQESHEDLLHFNRIWQTHFAQDSLLIYTTRRTPAAFEDLKTKVPLINPNVFICSLGTEMILRQRHFGFQLDKEWQIIISLDWDRNALFRLIISLGIDQLTLREKSEQKSHKISFKLNNTTDKTDPAAIVERIGNALEEADSNAKAILSDNQCIDIIPKFSGQGYALQHLVNRLARMRLLPRLGVQVNGNSGDDIDLFEVLEVKSCAVGNSTEELIHWVHDHPSPRTFMAKQHGAGGIIEGMRHFGFLTDELGRKMKIKSDIYESLYDRFRNQQSTGSVLSESFVLTMGFQKVSAKDGIIDLPKELGTTPSPLLYIDSFYLSKEDDSTGYYRAYYEVYDLNEPWGLKHKICGSLNVHLESQKIVWDALEAELERRMFDLTADMC